ncbi:VOC family protein [Streptomyces sp. NPDC056716]|uniref:VOC family protein n=1 Tax=unclassified Streptomyces TaxID=2593676 RepID=UPI0036ADE39E
MNQTSPFRQPATEWPVSPVTHVRYVAEAVPDLSASVGFYGGIWGLREVERDGDVVFFAAEGSPEPYVLRLRAAKEKHLDLASLAVRDRADVDRIAESMLASGMFLDRAPGALDTPGGGYGLRVFDPDGRLIEVSADLTPRPFRALEPGESVPRKVSHVVFNSAQIEETIAFYVRHLGFQVIDWLGDFMAFLRVGGDHHIIAITRAPHSSFNHIAFDMRGLDEYLRGTGRLVRQGVRPVWGPGRHGPGDNTFSYFVDPNGNVAEYTSELKTLTHQDDYCGRVWPATPEENDQWGTGGLIEEFLPFAINQSDPLLWTSSPV